MSARKIGTVAAAALGALVVLLFVAWGIDSGVGGTQVRHNVHIAGRDVGGLDRSELAAVMGEIDTRVGSTPVEIRADGTSLPTTLAELGVSLDQPATAESAFAARGGGFILIRPFRWLGSLFSDRAAPVQLSVDTARATEALSTLDGPVRTAPVEPTLAYQEGELTAVPGRPGSRLDPSAVIAHLQELDGDGIDGSTIVIDATLVDVPPKQSDESAQELLATVREHLDSPLEVIFGEESRTLDPTELEPFISAQQTDDGELVLALATDPTLSFLAAAFADVGEAPQEPELSVADGQVVVGEGRPGTGCCAPSAVTSLSEAIEQGRTRVDLELTAKAPLHDAAYYAGLGIKQEIASFTTQHPCCAPRVENIHRMADIIGAHVLAPGETFSLNDTVGRRTIENGFKAAPVIDGDGNFQEDVGGGVSQFSTTLFNAAFFAGLEIDEYMAHGLYISRYPYGREATLSFPSPDLKIRNITPYGVLIWPTYSDTSITVTMYSTPYIDAEQTGQSEAVYGAVCTQVTTLRTRTWLDSGKSEIDKFYALYAPGEGVQCDGSVRPKEGATTTTTAPPTTTTVPGSTTDPSSSPATVTNPPPSTTAASSTPGSTTSTAGSTTSATTSTG